MYDTVQMRLNNFDVPGVSFLDETAVYLDEITLSGENKSGLHFLCGNLGGLIVSLDESAARITKGSLCKWYLGDNLQELTRGDTRRALEKLSDTLHLPMDRAKVSRIDIAHNLIMEHPPRVYFGHLGPLRYATRLQEPEGIYYKQGAGRLAFYDKMKEAQRGGDTFPEIYAGQNVLRYERRFQHRLPKYLNEPEITGATLYDEMFYIKLVDLWLKGYRDISKINDIIINPEAMKSKKEFDRAARLALVEKFGGEASLLEAIKEMQLRGDLTKKQAFDMRKAVREACTSGMSLTVQSEAVGELERKIKEAAAYYR